MTATVRTLKTAAEDGLVRLFAERRGAAQGLADKRADAIALFEQRGLPHRRVEEWKWSDLRTAWREALPLAARPDPQRIAAAEALGEAFPGLEAAPVGFVDGRHVPALSRGTLPAGVEIRSVAAALGHGDRVLEAHLGRLHPEAPDSTVTLNTALLEDGAIVHVDPGVAVDAPLLLDFRYVGGPATVCPRVLVVVGERASVTIVESHRGAAAAGQNLAGVAEIVLGKGASVTHVMQQALGPQTVAVQSAFVELAAEARYASFALEEGGAFARRQLFVRFAGEGATVALNGATLGAGRQLLDTTLVVDHAVPHCESRETFKYVLAGEAHGVFQGKIVVRPDAQKTDGRMSARGLLLNEGPEFDVKPELEIYADDVVCAHGATAGDLDEDLLFYLRARGIPEGEAKALLVQAFVGEALETIENDALRGVLAGRIGDWLARNLRA